MEADKVEKILIKEQMGQALVTVAKAHGIEPLDPLALHLEEKGLWSEVCRELHHLQRRIVNLKDEHMPKGEL